MVDLEAGPGPDIVDTQAESLQPESATDYADLAARAADQATDLYAHSEHEQRQHRFDRAIRLARES